MRTIAVRDAHACHAAALVQGMTNDLFLLTIIINNLHFK